MLIRVGFDIQFEIPSPVAMIALFHVHQTRSQDLREPDQPRITPSVPIEEYEDSFGNICSRFVAPAGKLQLYNSTLIEDSGEPDPVSPNACQVPVEDLAPEMLRYLLRLPLLRSGPPPGCCWNAIRQLSAGMGARAGGMRLGANERHIRLPLCESDEDGFGCLCGSHGRLPRFSASRNHVLPLP